MHRASAFKRFKVNFESNNGCRYFFKKCSLITHFRPTNVETNTLPSAPCLISTPKSCCCS
uniref:Uncharacterized protein n=1 Tax=Arundo donax TaxID=35708 RepID=A0A0A9GWA2_ARUDO